MSIKPWREIARPHKDVLEGTFKQSEFAADISQVVAGIATDEYQDAEKFFSRTFITEGMSLLLMSVAQRLAGQSQGGDPVIQLQTAFGGGKTHTMLAVLHLALHQGGTDKLKGIPPILDKAGINNLPRANTAVIDGIKLAPSQPQVHGNTSVNTLWGELGWQLLREEGFAMVAESDADGTSPGKEVLRQLIEKASPCVILMDELVAFIRQLEDGKQFKAGTFDSNISFMQALTEALKNVPNAILLATLPTAEYEIGGTMGRRALDALEKCFGRIESVWKPVASTEGFEIVRRRLFEDAGASDEIKDVCRQFHKFYRKNSTQFPQETQSQPYLERLRQSYPIHPEIFDRLYEDWSTMEKFQRTRGVLQYMAIVIHHLWKSNNQDALIMPGSIALDDSAVRSKSIHYLPQGWESVIEGEVDGPRSEPTDIDTRDTRLGGVHAARRTMRTIFLGSAPSVTDQMNKGIKPEQILLGCAQPGQKIGIFQDALKHLRDQLHYLYHDDKADRYWLDTQPNLRREMESRKKNIDENEELQPLLKDCVSRIFKRNSFFSGIHIFAPSVDIPDDYATGPRLVVLPLDNAYSRSTRHAFDTAKKILQYRGEGQVRQKQNRLIFFAPENADVERVKDAGRTFLAWQSIVSDVQQNKLDLTVSRYEEAIHNKKSAEENFEGVVREAYKWLICPVGKLVGDRQELDWEAVPVSPATDNLIGDIEKKLREEEWVIPTWSPVHLFKMLQKWYFKEGVKDINALKIWQDSCHYLYLPRLLNDSVYKTTIEQGIKSEEYFGFASGKDGERYLGFLFGQSSTVTLDDSSLIIQHEIAQVYKQHLPQPAEGEGPVLPPDPPPEPPIPVKKGFYGHVKLDPVTAKRKFATVVDEVIQNFTTKQGIDVTVSVDIHATSSNAFDKALQRTVKENCKVLRFDSAEFEE